MLLFSFQHNNSVHSGKRYQINNLDLILESSLFFDTGRKTKYHIFYKIKDLQQSYNKQYMSLSKIVNII